MTRLKLSRIIFVDTPKLVHVIERLRVTFTSNGKSKFVPRHKVFPNKYCRLLLITSIQKWVVSRQFYLYLNGFYQLIFYFEKYSTWIAVNATLYLTE